MKKQELKTLNELVFIDTNGIDDSRYVKSLLKDEAIKWIKKLSKKQEFDLKFCVINNIKPFQKELIERRLNENKEDIVIWIKTFFNITEKDLKE